MGWRERKRQEKAERIQREREQAIIYEKNMSLRFLEVSSLADFFEKIKLSRLGKQEFEDTYGIRCAVVDFDDPDESLSHVISKGPFNIFSEYEPVIERPGFTEVIASDPVYKKIEELEKKGSEIKNPFFQCSLDLQKQIKNKGVIALINCGECLTLDLNLMGIGTYVRGQNIITQGTPVRFVEYNRSKGVQYPTLHALEFLRGQGMF